MIQSSKKVEDYFNFIGLDYDFFHFLMYPYNLHKNNLLKLKVRAVKGQVSLFD